MLHHYILPFFALLNFFVLRKSLFISLYCDDILLIIISACLFVLCRCLFCLRFLIFFAIYPPFCLYFTSYNISVDIFLQRYKISHEVSLPFYQPQYFLPPHILFLHFPQLFLTLIYLWENFLRYYSFPSLLLFSCFGLYRASRPVDIRRHSHGIGDLQI